jgi:hypothetical protein
VRIRRQLARANPADLPDLAQALSELGQRHGELGQPDQARVPLEEAAGLYVGQLERDPSALPGLRRALRTMAALQGSGEPAVEGR